MKERTGQISENTKTGIWTARVCCKNTNGKRTAIQRTAENKTDAKKLLKQLLEKLENGGRKAIDAEKLRVRLVVKSGETSNLLCLSSESLAVKSWLFYDFSGKTFVDVEQRNVSACFVSLRRCS